MVHPDNISSKPDFRVIIAGGRDFNDYALLKAKCDNILAEKTATHRIVIVSGAARGADSLGERYAREHGYTLDSHPADWNTHGKSAGYVRNAQMANSAEALIAFWDGHSRGTKHMIDTSVRNGLSVRTILYANQITKNNMEVKQQSHSDIDYLIDEDKNEVIVEADDIETAELCRIGKAMGGQLSTTKNGRIMFTFNTLQEGHHFGSTMVELAKARAIGNKNLADKILEKAYSSNKQSSHSSQDTKLESLKNKVSQYAIEHITGKGSHSGIAWFRDSFNEYCDAIGANEFNPDDISFELDDLVENLKKASWVAEIAGKPADKRTTADIDRVVNDFICEYWLMQPEEVTTKNVADVLKVADPLSHRHLVGQKIAIDCIHALNQEQLQQLDAVLRDLEKNPNLGKTNELKI